MPKPIVISSDQFVTSLSKDSVPIATIDAGTTIEIETSDFTYTELTGDAIDSGNVDFRSINRLTGPIAVNGAVAGDAIGFEILDISVAETAHVLFSATWRGRDFGRDRSSVNRFAILDNALVIGDSSKVPLQPMIGCIATAPSRGVLSSLAPSRSTGGNLDIEHIRPGATVWLPVKVDGGLLALGDLHASMGSGEPVGSGLECGGSVRGMIHLAPAANLPGIRIETDTGVYFVGSDHDDLFAARSKAINAAWRWLRETSSLSEESALALSAAMLDLQLGGPAGANIVATFQLDRLRQAGVAPKLMVNDVDRRQYT